MRSSSHGPGRRVSVSICTFVLVKQVKSHGPGRRVSVSMCTFVLVKQVNLGGTSAHTKQLRARHADEQHRGLVSSIEV
jgi:hypothetical protein